MTNFLIKNVRLLALIDLLLDYWIQQPFSENNRTFLSQMLILGLTYFSGRQQIPVRLQLEKSDTMITPGRFQLTIPMP
jgi:hypothetical protein